MTAKAKVATAAANKIAKHTPGPWTTDMRVRVAAALVPVLEMTGPRDRDTGCEIANARLIAAAPDLLEALRHSLHLIEKADADSGCLAYSEIAAQCRAALAKAGA